MFIQYDSHFNKMQRYSTRHASQEDVNFCVENNAVERNIIRNDIDIVSCERLKIVSLLPRRRVKMLGRRNVPAIFHQYLHNVVGVER